MAQIPFTDRELRRAWRELHAASAQQPRNNAHRLLLVYAIECGLKAMWLKKENRSLFDATDISRTGHDLNEVIKQLSLGVKLSPSFELKSVNDERRKPVQRKTNRIENLHQAWRYGGKLLPPVDDTVMDSQLAAVQKLIEKELKS